MMQKTRWENYSENEIFSAISMLYGNGHYSMQIILPKEGKYTGDTVEALITIGAFDIKKAGTVMFKADHPFVFVITERDTGMICFIGQYTGN